MAPHFESPPPPDPSSTSALPTPAPAPASAQEPQPPSSSSYTYTTPSPLRPTPRPPRTASRAARVRVRNRRREYLAREPAYLAAAEDHELADPVLYDALVRRFQTSAEREAEGRRRGYGHVLESSLRRGEAGEAGSSSSRTAGVDGAAAGVARMRVAASYVGDDEAAAATKQGPGSRNDDGEEGVKEEQEETIFSVEADIDTPPADRAAARERWLEFLRDRFVAGRDDEFDYSAVDDNEDYDALERLDAEEAWFDGEEPSWGDGHDSGDDAMDDGAGAATRERRGETGIQDY